MLRMGSLAALSALTLVVAGCGLNPRADAAQGIAKFLGAAGRDDKTAIEAGLDRSALRGNLRDQVADLGRASGIDVGAGPSEFAMDRMITAQAIQQAAARAGLPAAPSVDQVGPLLKMADKTHACVAPAGGSRCALSFVRRDGAWRLVGMQATDARGP